MPELPDGSPSGTRASSATMPARSPLVTHIFVPLMTNSSPSRTARQRSAPASEPLSGSDSEKQPRSLPVAIPGSDRSRCSSVPNRSISLAQMRWLLTIPASDIHPRESSSITRA